VVLFNRGTVSFNTADARTEKIGLKVQLAARIGRALAELTETKIWRKRS